MTSRRRYLAAGLLLGILLALTGAFLLHRFEPGVYDSVEEATRQRAGIVATLILGGFMTISFGTSLLRRISK